MKKIIKLTESDLKKIISKVLKEQTGPGLTTFPNLNLDPKSINPYKLKFGAKDKPNDTNGPVHKLQQKLMDSGFLKTKSNIPTGYFGNLTQNALSKYYENNGINREKPKIGTDNAKVDSNVKSGDRCIAISDQECKKISNTNQVKISSGSETRCSAYMVKCLSQYDKDLYGGNAWDVLNNVKNGGSVKYNAFTSGEINWNNIWSQLVKNKVSKSVCEKHASTEDADKQIKSAVPSIVTNSVPSSPKVQVNLLKLGDIVGLYHKNSGNKGMAFCQRVLKRGLDNNGNVKDKDPFTFNSHVGFVGAIKNGVPIIIHNVHGSHIATPATQMLNKNSEDMIVWVVSDNSVESAIKNSSSTQDKKKSYGWFN